ncbi:VWA domain-containing protein [Haloarcula rubripromontorii]|uniref:VWA domain-containing protein n=1 Tax=Haloarcula rubripromontorii TaxID=1705562 RepID=UPI00345C1B6D
MTSSTTKLQAIFGVLLLVTVGPVSGMMTGAGAGPLQTAGNDTPGASAGNQAVTTAGNKPTQTPAAAAGNQATGPLSTSWNGSTEPNASTISQLAPRENDSHPYPLVGDNQPTDPDGDGLYEDINGDGAVNIVDVDALSRHLGSTAAGANWSAYDYTGDNRTDVGDIQWLFVATRSTASNDTDGDGLPDAYEQNVTKTDPRVADSDGDAVIDGAEDRDNDTLPAYREYRLGTDPHSNDTDGDGLTDDIESRLQGVDPTDPDTDDDGVQDGAADPDTDSLSTYNETVAGTLVTNPDTDGDGLLDGTEVHQLGTDPLEADTDNDGLPDGEEDRLGTDLLIADSNDNGVSDGEESYTTTATNETLGVTLSLTGNGDVGNGTTIAPQDDPRFNTSRVGNMSASPVIELNSEKEFSSANVTLAYNETGVENESQDLAVFTYDPEAGIFVPLNSTVDAGNNTVTAETEHFSTFAVYNIENWATTYNATEPVRETGTDGPTPVDTTLLIDTSGSMDNTDPNGYAQQSSQRFVGGLLDVDRVAVLEFAGYAEVVQPYTTDHQAANDSINSLEPFGWGTGTKIGSSLKDGIEYTAQNSNETTSEILIFLTDGRGPGGPQEAEIAAEENITIYTIGFESASSDKLSDIATTTGGESYIVEEADDLPEVFSRVANTTTEINDTDGDGLSDEMEREGVILGGPTGDRVTTDPKSADTDGDGLSDSKEIGQYTEVRYRGTTISYYKYTADPTTPDTDYDGVNDGEELATTRQDDATGEQPETLDPRDRDTDGDGLNDLVDPEPLRVNTPPEFQYTSKPVTETLSPEVTGVTIPVLAPGAAIRDTFTVAARPTGSADNIKEIRIRQYVTSSVSFSSNRWRNNTYASDELTRAEEDYVGVRTTYGDEVGLSTPSKVQIVVVDDDGNHAIVNHDAKEYDADIGAGVSAAKATVPVTIFGSTAGGTISTTGGAAVSGISLSPAGVVAVGAIGTGAAAGTVYFVAAETTGSASGVQQGYQRTVPTSTVVRQWDQKDFSTETQALLQSGNIDVPLTLSAGATSVRGDAEYVAGYGAEYVYETSPLNSPADIDHVLSTAVVAETSEGYDVVIGENPNGDGHIALYILGSTIIGATSVETVEDTIEREKEDEQSDEELTDEEEIDDAPGTEQDWRLSEREKLWIRTVGDFALDVYRASEIVEEMDEDDEEDNSTELETTVFDMGKGQSTLIEAPAEERDETLLVDAGSDESAGRWEEHYREDLTSRLPTNSEGDYVIDHLVVSHNHTDHISYVDEILADDDITVRNLLFSGVEAGNSHEENVDDEAGSAVSTATLRAGDSIRLGEARVNVLSPNETADQDDAGTDENSVVLHIRHDSGEVLTTGDIRAPTEAYITTEFNSELSSVDILMASHHGTSAPEDEVVSDSILDTTTPRYLVISNSNTIRRSEDDSFAPDCAVFNEADERNIPMYWTAIHHDVEFVGSSSTQTGAESGITEATELQSRLTYDC